MDEIKTIKLTVLDPGDPGVGIHSVNDEITITIPAYLLTDDKDTQDSIINELCEDLANNLDVEKVVRSELYEAELEKMNAIADAIEAEDNEESQ